MTKSLISYKAGFGINKGEQEWLNFLNAWITARTADKWLTVTHKHWFGSLGWRKEAS
jgi:polar amino acid transport system substrate-binding protein